MAGYRKRIAYLDYLENGMKLKNAGFVRLEENAGQVRLEMRVKNIPEIFEGQYELKADGGGTVGRMSLIRGCGSCCIVWKTGGRAAGSKRFVQTNGVYVRLPGRHLLQAVWAEPTELCVESEESAPERSMDQKAGVEEGGIQPRPDERENGCGVQAGVEEGGIQPRPDEWESGCWEQAGGGEKDTQPRPADERESGCWVQAGGEEGDTQPRPDERESGCWEQAGGGEKDTQPPQPDGQEDAQPRPDERESGCWEQAGGEEGDTQPPQPDGQEDAWPLQTDLEAGGRAQGNEPAGRRMDAAVKEPEPLQEERTETFAADEAPGGTEVTEEMGPPAEEAGPQEPRAGESSHRTGEERRKGEPVCYGDKWEQLMHMYAVIHPFGDEREYLSITPGDFVVLRSEYQKMVHNSFLLHGYYNYHHLILGKIRENGEWRYYLGVPGNFYGREKMVAEMFGFEAFEGEKEPAKAGDFGYFLKRVEI